MSHVRKVVGGSGKKSCVSTGVGNPGNRICVTDRHDMTLDVKGGYLDFSHLTELKIVSQKCVW